MKISIIASDHLDESMKRLNILDDRSFPSQNNMILRLIPIISVTSMTVLTLPATPQNCIGIGRREGSTTLAGQGLELEELILNLHRPKKNMGRWRVSAISNRVIPGGPSGFPLQEQSG